MKSWRHVLQDDVGYFIGSGDFSIGQVFEAYVVCFLVKVCV